MYRFIGCTRGKSVSWVDNRGDRWKKERGRSLFRRNRRSGNAAGLVKEFTMKKPVLYSLLFAAALAAGFLLGRSGKVSPPGFHDMRVNHVADYTKLVEPDCKDVVKLAKCLGSPEEAYYFVRDRIAFRPEMAAGLPCETLQAKAGSCLGKAALLCSILRAQGRPPESVRVVVGHVNTDQGVAEHAWVEMEYGEACVQLDATDFYREFPFGEFTDAEYTQAFVWKEGFCFNDDGFALISQLNRFRNGPPPQAEK